MLSNLETLYERMNLIKKSGIPVDDLISIDIAGHFIVKEQQSQADYCRYEGIAKNGSVIAIQNSVFYWNMEPKSYDYTNVQKLIGYNIDGYSFEAIATVPDTIEENEDTKISLMYNEYEMIVKLLKAGATDEYIKNTYNLKSFKSSNDNIKGKQYTIKNI